MRTWLNPGLKFDFFLWVVKNIYRHWQASSEFGLISHFYTSPGARQRFDYTLAWFMNGIVIEDAITRAELNWEIYKKNCAHDKRIMHNNSNIKYV